MAYRTPINAYLERNPTKDGFRIGLRIEISLNDVPALQVKAESLMLKHIVRYIKIAQIYHKCYVSIFRSRPMDN